MACVRTVRYHNEVVLPVVPASNPTPVTSENLTVLLRAAWDGSEPE
jgi:maleylacetate reductase